MEYDFRGRQSRRMGPDDVPWDRILLVAPLVIAVIIIGLLAYQSVYTVEPQEKAVVLRFGKYLKTVGPGLQFCIPLVDHVEFVSVKERSLRMPFGEGSDRPRESEEELQERSLMLTGDLNAARVEWTIQWNVTDEPQKFLFRFHQEGTPDYPQEIIKTVAQTVMNRLVGDYSIDEVLTVSREEIKGKALEETQRILSEYDCGVRIVDLQMQQVNPPLSVQPAFDAVNTSIQRKDELVNEANQERFKLLPQARAEKNKLVKEADGYADRRRAETDGEIAALEAKFREYQRYPEETRQRLYLEAMEEVFGSVDSKVIVDTELQGEILPILPLEQGAKP
jgi:membrane protease subunit HflK